MQVLMVAVTKIVILNFIVIVIGQRNAVVLFMILLVSCDANTDVSDQKSHVSLDFDHH